MTYEEAEKGYIAYLEVNDVRTAGRYKKIMQRLEMEQDLFELEYYKSRFKYYKQFISDKGMSKEFENYVIRQEQKPITNNIYYVNRWIFE